MNRSFAATIRALPFALALVVAPLSAQVQQAASPIDDLIRRARDAFNDLNYPRADSLSRQVLQLGSSLSQAQRTGAMLVLVAAAYPEETGEQRRGVAMVTLRELIRTNMNLRMPQELSHPALDSLVDEARRTTFAMESSADSVQQGVGPGASARIAMRSSRPARFHLTIAPAAGGPAVVRDSTSYLMAGEIAFATMRQERPVFASGAYTVVITGVDSASRDSVTARYTAQVEAPPLEFLEVPTRIDSTRLLPERTRRFGARSIFPALLVGGATFALSSVLRGEGGIATSVAADSRGVAAAGAMALTTMLAGFADRGRSLPANIAANRAYGEAFQKAIVDAQAENRRRVGAHTTAIRIQMGAR